MNNITEGFASGLFYTIIPLLMIYLASMFIQNNTRELQNKKKQ